MWDAPESPTPKSGISAAGMRQTCIKVSPRKPTALIARRTDAGAKCAETGTAMPTATSAAKAGMTHGGFYRHFQTKDDLVIEALRRAFDEFVQPLERRQQIEAPHTVAAEYRSLYLSGQHVQNPGQACPTPSDRSSVRGVQRLIAARAVLDACRQ
jgi:AcrR family transcriptional regulator